MNIKLSAVCKLLVMAALALSAGAWAQTGGAATATNEAASAVPAPTKAASAPAVQIPLTQYSTKGADSCLECHDADNDTATHTTALIFKSRHGQRGNAKAPFGPGGLQCEACHGPGARHSLKGDPKATSSLKPNSFMSVAQRNEPCLSCHQDNKRNAWHSGGHDRNEVACIDCHKLHTDRDAVMAKSTEAEVCYTCHKQQRADFFKASSHPLRQGRMACSDCHNPHGSTGPAMLVKSSVNQTCYTCHADKRGPVLWEHAPVAEDCGLCHATHGANRQALLNKTAPLLCQQCHTTAGHPAVARTGGALPGGAAGGSAYLLAGGCVNCHSQVHGSNHPSGAKLMR
ncbi:MAG: hypothetical protein RL375_3523 [Pseudomonadota bacterium]|jgi:DmsE family decaheme c-type cytochrome